MKQQTEGVKKIIITNFYFYEFISRKILFF